MCHLLCVQVVHVLHAVQGIPALLSLLLSRASPGNLEDQEDPMGMANNETRPL